MVKILNVTQQEVMRMPVDIGTMVLHCFAVSEGAATEWAQTLEVELVAKRRHFEVSKQEKIVW